MENATQFSPPDVDVDVIGYRIADDSYQLTLADKGIGMSADQIATANKTLAEPPLVGLDLSRSLGFTVVSRLAHRLGVTVQLAAGADGGVTAVITIPSEMVGRADEADETPKADEAVELALVDDTTEEVEIELAAEIIPPASVANTNPLLEGPPAFEPPAPPPPTAEPDAAPSFPAAVEASDAGLAELPTRRPKTPQNAPSPQTPEPAPAAATDGDLFAAFGDPADVPTVPSDPSADLFAPIDDGASLPRRTPPAPDPTADPAPSPLPTRDPAAVGAVSPQVTSAGLIRRTPKQIDVPEESKYSPGTSAPTSASSPLAPTANRSPDEVRQMLSRYRAGLRKGRAPEPGNDQSNRQS